MANTLAPGTILQGQYRILRVLGTGGMGAVYLAEDTQLFGKQWAIKELIDSFTNPQERAAAWQQFDQEARILVSLDHPNLPKIVRYFSEGGRLYLVMEYIDGRTLEEILDQTPGFLPEAQVVDWARQICGVLDYLHSRMPPVIFRDLKPANIMLGRDNRIRLIDFGIARLFDPRKQTDTLKMGTHGYAPPEQYAGMGRTDTRSDVYGLGATMYHLLTNQAPVDSVQRILPQPMQLIPPRRLNPSLSPGVEQVILTATNVHPDGRYQSAAQMKAALSGQAVAVAPPVMVQCSRCGAMNRSTARFCSSCGQTMGLAPPQPVAPPPSFRSAPPLSYQSLPVPSFQPPPPPRPVATPPPQKQLRSRRSWVGLGAMLIVALACVIVIVLLKSGVISLPIPTATGVVAGITPSPTFTVPAVGSSGTPGGGPSSTPLPGATDAPPSATETGVPITDTPPPGEPTPTVNPGDLSGLRVSTEASGQGGIRVEIKYADGAPHKNLWVGIYQQETDISGNPIKGDRLAGDWTGDTGAVFFPLQPASYAVELQDLTGYNWGSEFNYTVEAGQATVLSLTLGRLVIGVRDADEQALQGRWTAVYLQQPDISGNPVQADRVADGWTDNTGALVYDLTPGLYAVEVRDIAGNAWGDGMNHVVASGQQTTIVVTLGRLTVGIKNADGQPVPGRWIGVYFQEKDLEGKPIKGERFLDGWTDNTGLASWDVTAGTYAVEIRDIPGNLWGEEINHTVNSGETTALVLNLGRLTVGLKDASGNPIQDRYVAVYYQVRDVSDNPIKGDRIVNGYTDNGGLVSWDMTAGDYVVEVDQVGTQLDVPVQAGMATFTDGLSVTGPQ